MILWFAASLIAAVAGFRNVTAEAAPAARQHRPPAPKTRREAPERTARSIDQIAAASPLLRRLTPVKSGPGVVVCEPVPRAAAAGVADFGRGCARWLNLVVGGQGEFGQTPLWGYTIYAVDRMRRPNLRLDQTAARRFAQLLGLTHVALGQIQGDAAHCTLSCQLWDMQARKSVGPARTLNGSEEAITAGLPRMAAGLAAELGAASPRVPAAVGETPAELQWLGTLPWGTFTPLSPETTARLHSLALLALPGTPQSRAHPPFLAAFFDLMWYGTAADIGHVMTMSRALTSALPDNALVLAQISSRATDTGRASTMDLPLQLVLTNLRRFPHNTLYHLARSNMAVCDQRPDEARAEAEWVARCAPRNPTAWWNLGKRIFAQADAIRHARSVTELTDQQMAYCEQRYDEYLPVAIRAALLDPTDRGLWRDVSVAAAFDGQERVADDAFWKAANLAPADWDTLWWGAQLYQPKWLDDADKLAHVARMIAFAGANWTPRQRVLIAWQIYYAGLPEPALAILRSDQERKALLEQVRQYREAHPEEGVPPPPGEGPPPKPAPPHQSA